jgi:hypothetical protein
MKYQAIQFLSQRRKTDVVYFWRFLTVNALTKALTKNEPGFSTKKKKKKQTSPKLNFIHLPR